MAVSFQPKRGMSTTLQGWLVTFGFVVAIVLAGFGLLGPNASLGNIVAFLVIDAILVGALWIVNRRMTTGQWRWRWSRD